MFLIRFWVISPKINFFLNFSQHLKPIISKGHSSKGFCFFFSFLWFLKPICVLWPCCIYFFSSPEQCATFVRSGFFIGRLENFLKTLEVASWGRFSELWENILHFFIPHFLKIDKNCSQLPQNHFWVSYDALRYAESLLGP